MGAAMNGREGDKEQLMGELGMVSRRINEGEGSLAAAERYIHELENAYLNMAINMVAVQEIRESYCRGHSDRVSHLGKEIASAMGLPQEEIDRLDIAARLHDLGRISIRRSILFKPAALTLEEWSEVHLHPARAVELLQVCDSLREVLPIIKGHHERYDGTGYPEGLKGDEIPLGSRILAVADAYDGMTSSRPYRRAMSGDEATEILRQGSGMQWDPQVVEVFLSCKCPGEASAIALAIGVKEHDGKTGVRDGKNIETQDHKCIQGWQMLPLLDNRDPQRSYKQRDM
jgi:HD-GYP domain-containing protein (c-di-GMP phosphodiesterase class II)